MYLVVLDLLFVLDLRLNHTRQIFISIQTNCTAVSFAARKIVKHFSLEEVFGQR